MKYLSFSIFFVLVSYNQRCIGSSLNSSKSNYPYKIEEKIQHRDKYVFIPVNQKIVSNLWSNHKTKIALVNKKLQQDKLIPSLTIRGHSHPDQPFHNLPPHLSISYKANVTEDKIPMLQKKVSLTFKPTIIKIIPPTMNGILSLVVRIDFDHHSKGQINNIATTFGDKPKNGWHITIGQSFYSANEANLIYNLYSKKNINLVQINENSANNLLSSSQIVTWKKISHYRSYFFNKLANHFQNHGFKIGFYNRKPDHIILN